MFIASSKQLAILSVKHYMCICTHSRTDSKMIVIGAIFATCRLLNKPLI